jgi:phenylalanyl-tRNA synthetase alpha chain
LQKNFGFSHTKMELPEKILNLLDKSKDSIDSIALADKFNEDHQKIVGALKSLEGLGNVIKTESNVIQKWQLTEEGENVAKNGSHEAIVYGHIPADGILQPDLMKAAGAVGKVGFSKAMSAGWLLIDKSGGKPVVKRKVDHIVDIVSDHLKLVVSGNIDQVK